MEEVLPLFSSISASFASFRGGRLGRVVAVVSLQEEIRSAVCWVLELLGCLRVLPYAAVDALAILAESVDLVLCDLDLAGSLLQGFQAAMAVHAEPRPIPPVVLICEKRMDRQKLSKSLDAGAKGYVAKPLRIQAIRGVVVRHANSSAPETPAEADGESSPSACDKRYEKVRVLGKGCFGEVSLVHRRRDGARFALKELSTGRLSATEQQKVLEELRLHRAFDCPLVVRYYTSWMQGDVACLLLEFVENGSLSNQVSKCIEAGTELSDASIVDWAGQILVGLLYLHRKEVVHRDLKLDNVLGPTDLGRVKLADFGISKRLSGALAKSVVGTPEIMAPERCVEKAEAMGELEGYGPESDLWSLGVVLYELATLRPPFALFEGDASNVSPPDGEVLSAAKRREQLFSRIRFEEPPPLPFSRAGVLHKVVTGGLLRKRPQDRPSVSDLCRDPTLGSAIHQFLRRNNLLEHPSILEVLDVLPGAGIGGGSRIESSDLDVLTLHSHDARGFLAKIGSMGASQIGCSQASTHKFLDSSRLSMEELAAVFAGVNDPLPVPSELPAGTKRLEALSEASSVNDLSPKPSEVLEVQAGSKRLEALSGASLDASLLPLPEKRDELEDSIMILGGSDRNLQATPHRANGIDSSRAADSGRGSSRCGSSRCGTGRTPGERPPRGPPHQLAPLELRPQLDAAAASEADLTDSARRRRKAAPPAGNYHTHPQRNPTLLRGTTAGSDLDRLAISPCSGMPSSFSAAQLEFDSPGGNGGGVRASSAEPVGFGERSNSRKMSRQRLQPLHGRSAEALRPTSSAADIRDLGTPPRDDGSGRTRRRACSVSSLPSLGEISGAHPALAAAEPDGTNSSASSSSRARRQKLAPMGSSSSAHSLHAGASTRPLSVPRLTFPLKESTPTSAGEAAAGCMTPPPTRNGSGHRLNSGQALLRSHEDDAGSAAEARARGDLHRRASASPGPSAGRSGSRGPPLLASQGASMATAERVSASALPNPKLDTCCWMPPAAPRSMSKCKSDAVLLRADAVIGSREKGSAVRSRPYQEVPRNASAAADRPRRRSSALGDDSGEPTVAWAGSKATPFAADMLS